MPTTISVDDNYAVEESTAIVGVSFTDEDNEAAIPSAITWTLTDENGAVINSRLDVSVDVPASSIDIVLSGDDLALQTGETGDNVKRYLLIEATYNSDLGSDLPLNDQLIFPLKNLIAVT